MILLTSNELSWIQGVSLFSKGYQRKIKHDIKKKLQQFYQIDLPLRIEKGFISNANSLILKSDDDINTVTSNRNRDVTF